MQFQNWFLELDFQPCKVDRQLFSVCVSIRFDQGFDPGIDMFTVRFQHNIVIVRPRLVIFLINYSENLQIYFFHTPIHLYMCFCCQQTLLALVFIVGVFLWLYIYIQTTCECSSAYMFKYYKFIHSSKIKKMLALVDCAEYIIVVWYWSITLWNPAHVC